MKDVNKGIHEDLIGHKLITAFVVPELSTLSISLVVFTNRNIKKNHISHKNELMSSSYVGMVIIPKAQLNNIVCFGVDSKVKGQLSPSPVRENFQP